MTGVKIYKQIHLKSRSDDVIDSVGVRVHFFEDGLQLGKDGRGVSKGSAEIIVSKKRC